MGSDTLAFAPRHGRTVHPPGDSCTARYAQTSAFYADVSRETLWADYEQMCARYEDEQLANLIVDSLQTFLYSLKCQEGTPKKGQNHEGHHQRLLWRLWREGEHRPRSRVWQV